MIEQQHDDEQQQPDHREQQRQTQRCPFARNMAHPARRTTSRRHAIPHFFTARLTSHPVQNEDSPASHRGLPHAAAPDAEPRGPLGRIVLADSVARRCPHRSTARAGRSSLLAHLLPKVPTGYPNHHPFASSAAIAVRSPLHAAQPARVCAQAAALVAQRLRPVDVCQQHTR